MINLTPLLKLYQKKRISQLKQQNYGEIQKHQLLELVKTASRTAFGRDHGFSSISSVVEYQQRVPLRTYEAFWNDYFKKDFPVLNNITWPGTIPCFAVSSGTTSGVTKYLPYTTEMKKSNTKAGLDLLVYHLENRPESRIFGGKSFILGGSTELVELSPGIFSGDLSGISVKTLPFWAKCRYFPPAELALLKDWEEKVDVLARQSLKEHISMLSGVPSWLLIFIKKLFEVSGVNAERLVEVYPELEMLVHGGVNFTPYRAQFEELLKESRAELREVYPASEGFIAIADSLPGIGMRLNLDHQIFYEFVPLEELNSTNPVRHWINTVETGVQYAIVLTTCSGLFSYVIGDTVTFTEFDPPRVLVTGRTSYYLSAFGEHVIEDELQDAIATAAKAIDVTVSEYAVGPVFPEAAGELGRHQYVIEFEEGPVSGERIEKFIEVLDKRLSERNEDYEAHRAGGFGLHLPLIRQGKPGMFAAWMKSRGKLGGQHKVPRVINDLELLENLLNFEESYN